ncbi:MAG: NB-ARC domain-containing protein [Chloroflexales bacterium]
MAGRRTQIKYKALEQQYEALMERLSFLKTEQVVQSDPSMRFTLLKQIEQMQQQCDAIEQELDALEQQLPGADPVAAAITAPTVPAHHQDWGEAPDVSAFHGRVVERATLAQWMTKDRCRIICILGIGGMGKTSLATVMAQQCQDDFSHLVWGSLRNALRLDDLLGQWIVFLSNQQQTDLPDTTAERIILLMDYLKRQRCLLVLDNLETILRGGQTAGAYREGYEGYGDLIRRVGEQAHQSLLLLTSREVPDGYERFDGVVARTLPLTGVSRSEGQVILHDKALSGSEAEWGDLINRYSGNPLALKLTSEFIREAYGGAIADFLKEGEAILGEVRSVLDQQFGRLTAFEQELMYWLAIEREPVMTDDLRETLLVPPSRRTLVEAIVNLRRRSLIERGDAGLTLQNVVMEYVTERLIAQVADEIVNGSIHLLNTHALMKAQAKEYVRNSQVRLILAEVLELLEQRMGSRTAVTARLTEILALLRDEAHI